MILRIAQYINQSTSWKFSSSFSVFSSLMSDNSHRVYKYLDWLVQCLEKVPKIFSQMVGLFHGDDSHDIIRKKINSIKLILPSPSAPARGWCDCTPTSHTRGTPYMRPDDGVYREVQGMQKREFVASQVFCFPVLLNENPSLRIREKSKESRKSKWVLSQKVCRICPMIFFFFFVTVSFVTVLHFYGVLREVLPFFETSPKYTSK